MYVSRPSLSDFILFVTHTSLFVFFFAFSRNLVTYSCLLNPARYDATDSD